MATTKTTARFGNEYLSLYPGDWQSLILYRPYIYITKTTT